jgi:hypothetical protein
MVIPSVDGGGLESSRTAVADRLGALSHRSVVLGHDVRANADLLIKIAEACEPLGR